MQFPALVTGVEHRNGVKEGREWHMTVVTAVDMSPTGKCATPLEFNLAKEDEDLKEKLDGQRVTLELRKIGTYKGRLDFMVRVARQPQQPAK